MEKQVIQPPYYAVIFTSIRTSCNDRYNETSQRMIELAKQQKGFLGVESARNEIGITVSYWTDLSAIKNWRNNMEHSIVREKGKSQWYESFTVRIAKVEQMYNFIKEKE
jgi:heme-degrading monooxygenase HmoA